MPAHTGRSSPSTRAAGSVAAVAASGKFDVDVGGWGPASPTVLASATALEATAASAMLGGEGDAGSASFAQNPA